MRNLSVRNLIFFALLVSSGLWIPFAAAGSGPDPNDLIEEARDRLATGDLDGTRAVLAEIRRMVSTTPEWDPDGMFARTLLPAMESRLGRLQETLNALDRMVAERQAALRSPQAASDEDILPKFTGWARTTIQEIRTEAETLVTAHLPDPADRAVLNHTPEWNSVMRRIEAMVLRRMARSLQRELDRIVEQDQRSEALQTRLDVVKRSTVDLAVERGRLQDDLKDCRDSLERERDEFRDQMESQRQEGRETLMKCRQDMDRYVQVLSEMLLDEGDAVPDPEQFDADPVGNVFASVLDQDLRRLRSGQSFTPQEISGWRRALGRYRHYNRVLSSARLAADQSDRIGTLEAALNDMRVETTDSGGSNSPLGRIWLPMGLLTLATAAAGWWLGRRGRRAAAPVRRDPDR